MKNYFVYLASFIFIFMMALPIFAYETVIEIKPNEPACVTIMYSDGTTSPLENFIESKENSSLAGYTKYTLQTTKKIKNAKAANANCIAKNIKTKIVTFKPLTWGESWACWMYDNCPDNEILIGNGPLGGGGVENKLPPSDFFINSRLILVNENLEKNVKYKQFRSSAIVFESNVSVDEQQTMAATLEQKGIAMENVKNMKSIKNKKGQYTLDIELKDGQHLQMLPKTVEIQEYVLPSQQLAPR